jgi:phage terminase large subunit-like protein
MPVEVVLDKLAELDGQFEIGNLYHDRWNLNLVKPRFAELGWPDPKEEPVAGRHSITHGQGYASMPEPIRVTENLVEEARLNHGGNEALSYQVACVSLDIDGQGNQKFNKKRSSGRIDAAVAMAMSVFGAYELGPKFPSIYEPGGERDGKLLTF